ncbi:hypothetical protein CCHL11_08024 [Colletotrichum chlorophyti]|uniref:Uncharacterized protein n=1 Tax=Colletotrichum chlorophyti TaxID=708187 RepID=A0A1Q8RM49_9PEZI|nr:hypothetical protein CCHL11_08024 [Colletotrichum chlorophyti]
MECDYLSNIDAKTPENPERTARLWVPTATGNRTCPRDDREPVSNLPTPNATDSESGLTPRASGDEIELSTYHVLDAQNLELLHHFLCHTSTTLGDARVFRDVVPRLGFQYNSVLRLILSISARHLAQLHPALASYYHDMADQHAAEALPDVTSMLMGLNHENCQAVYYATVLVCFSSFAKGPTPGNLLVVAEDGEVPWLGLLRGVRIVVNSVGIQRILAGTSEALNAGGTSVWDDSHLPEAHSLSGVVFWEAAFSEMADAVEKLGFPTETTHKNALDALRDIFEQVFGTTDEPNVESGELSWAVWSWVFILEDDFVRSLESSHPSSLLLLAYYGVLLRRLEHHWFMRGWAVQIIGGVSGILDVQYANLIQWPIDQVREGQFISDSTLPKAT